MEILAQYRECYATTLKRKRPKNVEVLTTEELVSVHCGYSEINFEGELEEKTFGSEHDSYVLIMAKTCQVR